MYKLLFILFLTTILWSESLIGTPAPLFRMKIVNKTVTQYADLSTYFSKEHSQAVVLSFFAEWCAPCMKELPFIQNLVDSLDEKGIELIVVSIDKKISRATLDYLDSLGINAPLIHDSFGIIRNRYKYKGQLPYTIYISRDGIISNISTGFSKREQLAIKKSISTIVEGL